MEFMKLLQGRRSTRKYLPIPVEFEKIMTIMDGMKYIPSSGNLQDWKFIVVVDKEKRQIISDCCLEQDWIAKAPVHIIVVADVDRNRTFYGIRGERLYVIQDSAVAATYIELIAQDMGLGACWVGGFDESRMKELLQIPGDNRPQVVITLGYTDEMPLEKQSLSLYDYTFLEKYGGRIADINEFMQWYSPRVQKAAGQGKAAAIKVFHKLIEKGKEALEKKE